MAYMYAIWIESDYQIQTISLRLVLDVTIALYQIIAYDVSHDFYADDTRVYIII